MLKIKYLLIFLVSLVSLETYAAIAVPGGCGTLCMANRNAYMNQYGNYNNCRYPYNTWTGVHAYPQYQQPWRDPNRYYAQPVPYGGYGNCYNCNSFSTQPVIQPYSGSTIQL